MGHNDVVKDVVSTNQMAKKTVSAGPSVDRKANFIKLRLIDPNGDEVHFQLKLTVAMGAVKQSFADRTGADLSTLRMFHKRRQVKDEDTPGSMNMVDNDVVKVQSQNRTIPKTTESAESLSDRQILSDKTNTTGVPVTESKDDFIILKLMNKDVIEYHFRVKEHIPFGKLKKSYAERKGIDETSISFFFGESPINDDATPTAMKMKEGDALNVQIAEETKIAVEPTTSDSVTDLQTQFVNLKVVDHFFHETDFHVSCDSSLDQLKKNYAINKGVALSSLRFMFNCREIKDADTPLLLKMENDDAIDVFQE